MSKKRLTSRNTIPDVCVHLNGVAPAPRRDFFDFKVTQSTKKVTLIKWIITSRQEEGKFRPSEFADNFEDFPSEVMLRFIPFVFGKDIVPYVEGVIRGEFDWLVRLPDDLLLYLLTFVNLEDIERLSHVCSRLRNVCTSDALWKELFFLHMPSLVSAEIESLADENGWKGVFFSRIFERRLRAKHLAQSMSSEASTPRNDTPSSWAEEEEAQQQQQQQQEQQQQEQQQQQQRQQQQVDFEANGDSPADSRRQSDSGFDASSRATPFSSELADAYDEEDEESLVG